MSIILDQLTKRYGGHPVVNNVSLEVADGEFFVLLGSSGSGKTTVLSAIAGLTEADHGRVILHGRDVTHLPPQERRLGFVFQNYALFQYMTVADNIEFGLSIRKTPLAERRRRRDELLELHVDRDDGDLFQRHHPRRPHPALPQPRPGMKRGSGLAPRRSSWGRQLLVGAAMAYVAFLIVAPLVGLVAGAFSKGGSAIIAALVQPDVLAAFRLTLLISLITVVVHTLGGTAVAWVLVRHEFRGQAILNGLIDMPFAVSPVVVGYMLLLLFGRNGLLGPILSALDIKVVFAVPGMVLATLFVTLPFMIRELIPVLAAFGVQQEHAAATLGASGWQTFRRVTLPALHWGMIYGLTLTFARALGEFGAVLVVGGGVRGRTETATLYIFRALDERQYVAAYSAALVLGLLSLLLVVGTDLLRRRQERR
jgi:sulfate transport system permease protein